MGLTPPPLVLAFGFVEAPPTKRRCRRPEPLAVPYPEHRVNGRSRQAFSLFERTPLSPAERAYKPESDRILRQYADLRRKVRRDCVPGGPRAVRPCPCAACRYHLGVTINDSDSLKLDHGHTNFELLEDTCVLDVAARGKQTHEAVAKRIGISMDWVRASERDLKESLTRKIRKRVDADEWDQRTPMGGRPARHAAEAVRWRTSSCTNCGGEGYRWPDGEVNPSPKGFG